MGRFASAFAFLCLTLTAIPAAVPMLAVASSPVVPAASSYALSLTADRISAERNETIAYRLFLNVTGGGQLALARVNFTVEPDLDVLVGAIASPPDCGVTIANTSYVEWQCTSLRVGRSYAWSLDANVSANATLGRYRVAAARAIELGGGPAMPRVSQASVWIVTGVLDVTIVATPPASVFAGGQIEFNITVVNFIDTDPSNTSRFTAYDVVLTLGVGAYLDVGNLSLVYGQANLTPGSSMNVIRRAIVNASVPLGTEVGINATLTYRDATNRSIGPNVAEAALTVTAAPLFQPNLGNIVVISAFGVLTILVAIAVNPILGERKLVIDEVFLMHRSGILIQHLSRGPGLRKDDDLVASMFVAIQEFVRDSFDTKATLDELSFGGRKTAVLRGEHVVLAALISKGSPRYLFPQMKAVERDLEEAHGANLKDWDGRVSRLDQARPILEVFLRGGYRHMRGWRST
ncbi:MAG TPA: hypothetical protein VEO20_09515 [Thermoplasmata archaeon]|nr:hypothetical protein [Thermoplasmata archaeon]